MDTKQAAAAGAGVAVVVAVGWGTALIAGGGGPSVETTEAAVTPSLDPSTPPPLDDSRLRAIRDDLPLGPAPTPTPTPTPTETAEPEPSYPVAEVQRKLTDLGYYRGPVDGEEGAGTTHAVTAFQKVQGLTADGVVGPQTLAALDDPATPQLRSGPPTRIEIDLGRQVLYWVEGGELSQIFPVSSGSGDAYTTQSGSTAYSLTPVGWFEIERRISGIRDAPLGILYDPMYFYKGWAVHGSNHVPAYPASHGCVRLPRPDARWLFDRAPDGTPVHLYNGEHTFEAGSPAPGTDTPAGDTSGDAATPSPAPDARPDARNDEFQLEAGRDQILKVLANDEDDGPRDQLRLTVVDGPARGKATVEGHSIRYRDTGSGPGKTRFVYRLCDNKGDGRCDIAEVRIGITAPSPSPSPPPSTSSPAPTQSATGGG